MIKEKIILYKNLLSNLNEIREIEKNLDDNYKPLDDYFLCFLRDTIPLNMYRDEEGRMLRKKFLQLSHSLFKIKIYETEETRTGKRIKGKRHDLESQTFGYDFDEYCDCEQDEKEKSTIFTHIKKLFSYIGQIVGKIAYFFFLIISSLLVFLFIGIHKIYGFLKKNYINIKIFLNLKRSVIDTNILINKLKLFSDMNNLIYSLKYLEDFNETNLKILVNIQKHFNSNDILKLFNLVFTQYYEDKGKLELFFNMWKTIFADSMFPLVELLSKERKNINLTDISDEMLNFLSLNESLILNDKLEKELNFKPSISKKTSKI